MHFFSLSREKPNKANLAVGHALKDAFVHIPQRLSVADEIDPPRVGVLYGRRPAVKTASQLQLRSRFAWQPQARDTSQRRRSGSTFPTQKPSEHLCIERSAKCGAMEPHKKRREWQGRKRLLFRKETSPYLPTSSLNSVVNNHVSSHPFFLAVKALEFEKRATIVRSGGAGGRKQSRTGVVLMRDFIWLQPPAKPFFFSSSFFQPQIAACEFGSVSLFHECLNAL